MHPLRDVRGSGTRPLPAVAAPFVAQTFVSAASTLVSTSGGAPVQVCGSVAAAALLVETTGVIQERKAAAPVNDSALYSGIV